MAGEPGKTGLGARIAACRRSSRRGRWTQARLAAEVGISEGYLWKIENGKQSPSVEVVERIAEVLEVSLSFLILGDGTQGDLEEVVRPFTIFVAREGLNRRAVQAIVRGLSAARDSVAKRPS